MNTADTTYLTSKRRSTSAGRGL